MKRTFLDWNQPCIPALAELLLLRHQVGNTDFYDLSEYVLVFPNRTSSKRFLTALSDYAWKNHWTIDPPRVKHMGDFMELLYEQKAPFASLLTQQVVWMKALRYVYQVQPALFATMFPTAPAENDYESWFQMGAEMVEIFQEIARESMDFADVARVCHQLMERNAELPPEEVLRWDFLAQVEAVYFRELDRLGLWDRQAARLFALRNAQAAGNAPGNNFSSGNLPRDFQISFRLGIVGCVDFSRLQRDFLKRVSANVDVFIFAPETMADRFEEDGTLKTGKWSRVEPELNKKLFRVLKQETKPEEQVAQVVKWLREIAPRTGIEEVTLGIADESVEPILLQELSMAGVNNTRAEKKILADLQPWKMLERMCAYLRSVASAHLGALDVNGVSLAEFMEETGPEYTELALFFRQEDFGNYIRSLRDELGNALVSGDWIAELDAFYNEFYPMRMPSPERLWNMLQTAGRWRRYRTFFRVYKILHNMMAEYAREYVNFQSLLTIATQFLKKIYCWKENYDAQDEREYQIIRGCMELNHIFGDKFQLPPALTSELPLALPQALQILLAQTMTKQMPTSRIPQTISIQRWLDLPLDDASAMALIGMNENYVPETVTEHIFLPNRLREELKIKTNQNRFERDIYNLSLILASRKDICVTLGRISMEGEALFPSRLLLTEESDELISQVKRLFDEPKEEMAGASESEENTEKKGSRLFRTPDIPASLPPIQEMSVTDFSVFIENPYLFYLQRYLRLQSVADSARELDAASFGSLLHRVVQRFGEEEISLAVDPAARASALQNEERFAEEVERIRVRLAALLKIVVAERFGKNTLPVVELQCAQLRERLLTFAEKQAEQYREGWRIWAVERKMNAFLREDGGRGEILYFGEKEPSPMLIRGQLDRIDCRMREDGAREWRIWDYKTASLSPTEKHFGRKYAPDDATPEMWKDLQLPLYMHVLRSERLNETVPDATAQAGPSIRTIDTSHLSIGYILLPKKASETKFVTSDWSSEIFKSAEERIREIAHAVHDKKLNNNGEMGIWDRKTVVEWILNPN